MKLYKHILELFLMGIILGQVPVIYASPSAITLKDYGITITIDNVEKEEMDLTNTLTIIHPRYLTLQESVENQINLFNKDIRKIKNIKIITKKSVLTKQDLIYLNNLGIANIDLSLADCENNEIPNDCFYRNDKLTKFIFPQSLKSIGDYAFAECRNLTGKLTLPNNLVYIGENSFAGCGYDSFSLPKQITTIPKGFANRWENLKELIIEEHIDTIEEFAFIGTDIEKMTILSEKPLNIKGEIFGE